MCVCVINCEVLLMTSIMPNTIGNYPDGRPVYFDPEKAAEKRKAIANDLAEKAKAEGKKPPITISFAPELEGLPYMDDRGIMSKNSGNVTVSYAPDYIKEKSKPLENSPDKDTVELGSYGDKIIDIRKPEDDEVYGAPQMHALIGEAKIDPKKIPEYIAIATSIVKAIDQLWDVGNGLVDKIVDSFKPKNDAERAVLKSIVMASIDSNKESENAHDDIQQKPMDITEHNPEAQANKPSFDKVA